MDVTTLCYMEKDGKYLMLHRIKKKNDINEGKWIAPGGHCENGESPDDCVIREVMEETGIKLNSVRFRGIVTFYSKAIVGDRNDLYEGETGNTGSKDESPWAKDVTDYMCLFTSDDFEVSGNDINENKNPSTENELVDCNEGVLEWISKEDLRKLDLWKGDLIFLDLIKNPQQPFFSLKLTYEGDKLTEAVLDSKKLDVDKI